MTQTIAILGRQPALGVAELESLYGAKAVQPLGTAALLNMEPDAVDFDRLGGTVKLAKLLTNLNTTEWSKILKYLTDTLPQHLTYIPDGKIRFGLSIYGLPIKPATLNRGGLDIKKVIKRNGRSVRIVPNTAPGLNTAQVIHNQLTGPTGMELLLIRQGKQTLLAQTVKVQDITAYAARDQARPKRDAKVGMLPPKLAQIIINLATGSAESSVVSNRLLVKEQTTDYRLQTTRPLAVFDPFCGTGVILQEASLMGFDIMGSDLEPRMVEYTEANLQWLLARIGNHETASSTSEKFYDLQVADATNVAVPTGATIACETYLGRPFSALPKPEVLAEVMQDVDTIHRKFLQNVARQTASGFQMCIAVPAWKTPQGFKHLRMLDCLEDLGYTRQSFVHTGSDQLIYHRPEQVVARELIVLQRK